MIEGWNNETLDGSLQAKYPGKVIGYKKEFGNVYQSVYFPVDPRQFFRIWLAGTIKVYGVYMGTDKIGHFTDMGMHYYKAYVQAREQGQSPAQATQSAIAMVQSDPLFSEAGFLGYWSAGDYSNADLSADYLGLLFYRNLTEPVHLKGQLRPPMLIRAGPYWQIASFVGRGSNFFSRFISDHLDEALNPGLFESDMRGPLRRAVAARTTNILWRYEDAHGCRRSPQWFNAKARNLSTYYGVNYDHRGTLNQLITVGNTCYQPPDMSDVNSRNRVGQTPLHWAVLMDDVAMVRHLLAVGADVNAQVQSDETYSASWGDTPLHLAARQGWVRIAKILIADGANVNAANDRGVTPLHLAYAHPAVARVLLAHGANVNASDDRGRTALDWAASDPHAADLSLLIRHGANVNHLDHRGYSVLQLAAGRGSAASVRTLLAHGANVRAVGPLGITALHLAAGRKDGAPIVAMLIKAGAKVNAADAFGWTALMDASRWGCVHPAAVLIAHNARMAARDDFGNTPLHLACRYDHTMVARLLTLEGSPTSIQNQAGDTPLHEAAATGDWTLAYMLLRDGGQPGLRNAGGLTAAQVAGRQGYDTLGDALVTAGGEQRLGKAQARR